MTARGGGNLGSPRRARIVGHVKLVHIRKREGRRGGKLFRNGGGVWGVADMTGRRDRRTKR
jgi:hypothetical protein